MEDKSELEVLFPNSTKKIQLNDLRNILIRQEETIIFAFIERAQFVKNDPIYIKYNSYFKEKIPLNNSKSNESFMDFLLMETEKLHSLVRRYTSPDENPFFPNSICSKEEHLLPSINYPTVIVPNNININDKIKFIYINTILPQLTKPGNDLTSYGSSAVCDIHVLQALSKRIHYGKFIAEAKYQEKKELYTHLIQMNDSDRILKELTNIEQEENVLRRVKLKASTYGMDINNDNDTNITSKVDPEMIRDFYRDFIMPLTKEVQVAYLLGRLKNDT